MNYPKLYQDYSACETQELCEIMAGREECGSKANVARLVYEERMMQKQHEIDRSLVLEQVKWMKFSVGAAVFATVFGAVAGAITTATLQERLAEKRRPTPQQTQRQIESPNNRTIGEQ